MGNLAVAENDLVDRVGDYEDEDFFAVGGFVRFVSARLGDAVYQEEDFVLDAVFGFSFAVDEEEEKEFCHLHKRFSHTSKTNDNQTKRRPFLSEPTE